MTKKPCPDCVINVGGALVKLRHHLLDAEPLFAAVHAALEESKPHMQAEGMMQAEYGPALVLLHEAQAAYGKVLSAHLHLAGAMDRIGIETPTDKQIAKAVAIANWR